MEFLAITDPPPMKRYLPYLAEIVGNPGHGGCIPSSISRASSRCAERQYWPGCGGKIGADLSLYRTYGVFFPTQSATQTTTMDDHRRHGVRRFHPRRG